MTFGADKYRVVQGIIARRPLPEWADSLKAAGRGPMELRFKALLIYDPFEKAWNLVTQDVADTGQAFFTNRVDEALIALRFCGKRAC